jgi:hypothetical protein
LEIYRQRVHSAWNILHWPSFEKDLEQKPSKPPRIANSISALETATCFMAVCALTDDEAQQMGIRDRKEMMEQYRVATQNALSKANLIKSPDLMVLQAFLAYLVR